MSVSLHRSAIGDAGSPSPGGTTSGDALASSARPSLPTVPLENSSLNERIGRAAGGCWAEVAWEVLQAWPRHALEWGVDLRPGASQLAAVEARILASTTTAELGAAIAALGDIS